MVVAWQEVYEQCMRAMPMPMPPMPMPMLMPHAPNQRMPRRCAYYYSGAASAAGISYTGAILASKSGAWPSAEHHRRIEAALERAGIKMWELSNVDNDGCMDAPLQPVAEMATA